MEYDDPTMPPPAGLAVVNQMSLQTLLTDGSLYSFLSGLTVSADERNWRGLPVGNLVAGTERLRIEWWHKHMFTDRRNPAMWTLPRRSAATVIACAVCLEAAKLVPGCNILYVVAKEDWVYRTARVMLSLARLNGYDVRDRGPEQLDMMPNRSRLFVKSLGSVGEYDSMLPVLAVFDLGQDLWDESRAELAFKLADVGTKVIMIAGVNPVTLME